MKLIQIPCIFLSVCSSFAEEPKNVPISELGKKFELVGKLHVPIGKIVMLEGIAVEGRFKGYEGGPNLRVQRIDGLYTQEDIQIVISPYFSKWGEETGVIPLPKLEMGRTYEMEGYETGGFVGIPEKAYKRVGVSIQTTGHYFRECFVVFRAKSIKSITPSPRMFAGKQALIEGIARTKDGDRAVVGDDWTVIVARGTTWPAEVEGKPVEILGLYKSDGTGKRFDLLEGEWRLVRLEDQMGAKVFLRGQARSVNGHWWFHYRGQDIYVENREKLPNWTSENHWRPMVIEGKLDRAKLPRLDQITLKNDPDLQDYYVVREASWKPLSALLSPELDVPPIEQRK